MKIKAVFKRLGATVLTVIVLPVASTFAVALAKSYGWLDDPQGLMRFVIEYFASLASEPWYPYVLGWGVGLIVGLWADTFAARFDARASKQVVMGQRCRQLAAEIGLNKGRIVLARSPAPPFLMSRYNMLRKDLMEWGIELPLCAQDMDEREFLSVAGEGLKAIYPYFLEDRANEIIGDGLAGTLKGFK